MKRRFVSLPESGRGRSRSSSTIVLSAAIHVVAIAALAHVLAIPTTIARFFETTRGAIPAERVGFISLPSSATGEDVAGRIGGDGRPLVRPREEPGLVAPARVPVGVPDGPPAEVARDPDGGSGPLVGVGGPTQGVRPAYRDPRLWRDPAPIVTAPRSVRETIDSTIVADVNRLNDSLMAARPGREPGDWTFERGGRKYGIDQRYIRLGPVSIPTAVLALLPINAQANPSALERDRALSYMTRDIQYHAQRAVNEDEFRRNVRNLRERKERERAERAEAEERGEGPATQ